MMDRGIFVITLLLSTVTVNVAPDGNAASVKVDGTVKFFGSQSSIKKPMVGDNAGSTCGLIVVVSVTGGTGIAFLSQELKEIIIKGTNKMKRKLLFVIILVCNNKINSANLLQAEESARNIYCQN